MYKNLLGALLLLISISVKAQLTMTVQVPPEGIMLKPQLWNFMVANAGSGQEQIKIVLTMKDLTTQETVMTGTSNTIFVQTGATPLLAADLSPITYEYFSPRFTDMDPNGFLPVGQYEVCYTLFKFAHIDFTEVAESCTNVYIEPLSPPMLSLPADGSESEINTPQFSWLPPAPINMFNILSYDFTLVEVVEGQTAQEAIQQNMPVYTVSNHPDIFINYPSSYTVLDTGRLYAWQVKANNNNEYVAQSEVWKFKVRLDTPMRTIRLIESMPYVRVKKELDATTSYCEGVLKFIYDNTIADSTVSYVITSLEEEDLGEIMDEGTLELRTGENLLSIPFLSDERLIDKHIYLLTLANSNKEKWLMRFIYNAPGTAE